MRREDKLFFLVLVLLLAILHPGFGDGISGLAQKLDALETKDALASIIAALLLGVAVLQMCQLHLAHRTTKAQLRAYLGVVGGSLSYDPQTQRITVQVEIKNSGQTPAADTRNWGALEVTPAGDFDFSLAEKSYASKSFLCPGESIHCGRSVPVTAAAYDAICRRAMVVRHWGVVEYQDIFGRPREFIFRQSMSGMPHSRNGLLSWGLQPDPSGYSAT